MRKYGMIVWMAALTLLCGGLVFLQFRGRASGGRPAASGAACQVAFFEMDSVKANFSFAKEFDAGKQKKEDSINAQLSKMDRDIQQRYNYFQEQITKGVLNQAQSDEASRELKLLVDQLEVKKQALYAEYNDFLMRYQRDIDAKVEEFLQKFNAANQYAYILSYNPGGGLFYYKDKACNITAAVVKGLNEEFAKK